MKTYEDAVIGLLGSHGAELVQRAFGDGGSDSPHEVQIYTFPDQDALDAFLADPRRQELADERDRVIARTELFPVDLDDRSATANGVNVEIDWEAARQANLENWEDRVALHEKSYGLERFDDPDHLSDVVRHDLPVLRSFLEQDDLAGLDVCHLQCHIGTDTVSLARAGARVTGVDFSRSALETAARFAERSGADVTWIESDVLDARAAVPGDFDVVYTSIGTITWLDDLDRWAAQVHALLRPGGTFFIRDGHPALYALDENAAELTTRYPYFGDGRAQRWDDESTYAGPGTVAHPRTYEWPHPLSEILGALLRSGLRLLHFDEGRVLPWRFSSRMVEVEGGFAWPEAERDLVPCTYTIVARRDG
ncbi:bifunctional 2-polyprenyl-6-hydroxyphenol methylase/3-demethylubiquinol 3-O-methyltransferase UbiG [Microbacterium sp. CIAB417]|uniref:class I SAM-dependent methyltransferase n=1 Tax=Microbacterium sp. CIAB417 TaxID=2860287 RepID=UPI001FAD946B|nr:class I SAM-dependent methyltransferase [Microbacterium sp. CIAB417]